MERVLFRKWKPTYGSGIIAILPDVEANPNMTMMYEHIGQHGEGSYPLVLSETTPANQAEYSDLLVELELIGYALRVVKRLAN